MILAEEYVKVPGKMYKVKIECVSTRRLTTMEWLIVNCVNQFRGYNDMKNKTLKYIFEEIFQLTTSEILVRPCIDSLINEQVIKLDVDIYTGYSNLQISQIKLTDKGRRMAQDGLFPGDSKELPIDIYYNPLTETIAQYMGYPEDTSDVIDFGVLDDYQTDFPKEKIVQALHRGLVGKGKFVASKLRIENIECLVSSDWDDYTKLEVNADLNGNITTKPEIKEDGVKNHISDLLFTREITPLKMELLVWKKDTQNLKILGSGRKLKDSFLNVSRNGECIAVSEKIYALYKRNTSIFKKKTIFVWGTEKFVIENEKDNLLIKIPIPFEIPGCVAINEKNESVSFCKMECNYEGKIIIAPIAGMDERIKIGERDLARWLEKVIDGEVAKDVRYLALYSLKYLQKRNEIAQKIIRKCLTEADGTQTITILEQIKNTCKLLGTEMLKLDDCGLLLWEKFDKLNAKDIVDRMSKIMELDCIESGSKTQKFILDKVLSRVDKPRNYNELFALFQSIGIRTHEDALLYDDIIERVYSKELIADTFKIILEDKYTRLPEFFELDRIFNSYVQSIKNLEFLVTGLSMFDKNDDSKIAESIEKCSDLASVRSNVAELLELNTTFLNKGINLQKELKQIDSHKANNFFHNVDFINRKITFLMYMELQTSFLENNQNNNIGDLTETKNRKLYVMDTCALIHHPDILLYFNEDEYVRIPTKVIDELGKIKDMRSKKYDANLSRTAAKMLADIERKYLLLFNKDKKMRLIIENTDLDLLPVDLDKNVPDNQILSVALKYKEWNPIIISDDGCFRLTSMAQNIIAQTSEEFIEEHSIYKKNLNNWMEKFVKAGGSFDVHEENQEAFSTRVQAAHSDLDELPIKELKKYFKADLIDQVISYLQWNGIKTIGEFRNLTPSKIESFRAKGSQMILRNTLIRIFNKVDTMLNVNSENTAEK